MEPPARGQRLDVGRAAEVHVHGRELLLATELLEHAREEVAHARQVVRRREEPRARHRRERDTDEQLRVVLDARTLRGRRPRMVEHELAMRVCLHVERACAEEPFAVPERQVLRQPPGALADRLPFLERREPLPFQERRVARDERVPRRRRHLAHRSEDANGRRAH
jgi:hypothetical protein